METLYSGTAHSVSVCTQQVGLGSQKDGSGLLIYCERLLLFALTAALRLLRIPSVLRITASAWRASQALREIPLGDTGTWCQSGRSPGLELPLSFSTSNRWSISWLPLLLLTLSMGLILSPIVYECITSRRWSVAQLIQEFSLFVLWSLVWHFKPHRGKNVPQLRV